MLFSKIFRQDTSNMNYPLLISPFDIEFSEMNPAQAREHLKWFISQIPERIKLLSGVSAIPLDYSDASLIHLWEWFLPRVRSEKKSNEEMSKELSVVPEWLKETYSTDPSHTNKLTKESSVLAIDISMYFSNMFLNKYPMLKWSVNTKAKKYVYYNKPVISGFGKQELSSVDVVINLTRRVAFDGDKDPNGLFNLYSVWSEYIPND
ncbi:hypothetical protein [Brevibacillus choshinensis]|uniref:hypothetical protein n=1 Tax=Brevibacillus choshinensis TaxID=54911 RepID=UPI002E23BF65|nr:hypothetical protein [Brevibacillus choshinensis]MED4780487.1 hypothetical protein [Brevibacillus choshinensis]